MSEAPMTHTFKRIVFAASAALLLTGAWLAGSASAAPRGGGGAPGGAAPGGDFSGIGKIPIVAYLVANPWQLGEGPGPSPANGIPVRGADVKLSKNPSGLVTAGRMARPGAAGSQDSFLISVRGNQLIAQSSWETQEGAIGLTTIWEFPTSTTVKCWAFSDVWSGPIALTGAATPTSITASGTAPGIGALSIQVNGINGKMEWATTFKAVAPTPEQAGINTSRSNIKNGVTRR